MIALHSLETAAKPSSQKTMVLSFSCAAVSKAPRQQLNRDSCKSPNTQWKMPSEEKGARGRGKRGRVRGGRGGGRQRERGRVRGRKAEKKLMMITCHQLELYFPPHHHHPSPSPLTIPPHHRPSHTHTHTHNIREVGRLCPCVTMFSPSRHCLERQSSSSSSLPPAFSNWYSTVLKVGGGGGRERKRSQFEGMRGEGGSSGH